MTQLFAAYLTQKLAPELVSGQYDPEQELWVADNQLQGVTPFATRTNTNTRTTKGTLHQTAPGVADRDTASDSDTDFDSDN